MDLQLKNKVALVAGASKGLGFAVASALAAEGALVSISSRDEKAIAEAAAQIQRATGARGVRVVVTQHVRGGIVTECTTELGEPAS